MTGVSRRFWIVGATLVGVTAFLSTLAAQGTCQCKDMAFLLNVLSGNDAVIDKAHQLLTSTPATALTTATMPGSKPPVTYRQFLNTEMGQAIRRATNAQVPNGTCLTLRDYRDPQETNLNTVIQQWEFTATQQNREVLDVLKALPATCRPNDWFGSITASETLSEDGAEHIPAKNSYEAQWDKGTSQSFTRAQLREGTIWLPGTDDEPLSFWQVAEEITSTSVHLQLVACEQNKPANISQTSTTTETTIQTGSAFKTGQVDASMNEDRNTLFLTFFLPEVEQSGTYDKTNSLAGGCPNDKAAPSEHMSMRDSIGKLQAEVKAPIAVGTPMKASGSTTINLPKPSPTGSHTIQVSYHLYKLR